MTWDENQTREVLQALAVTCEITGTTYSEPARKLILEELQQYEYGRVMTALRRCVRECKGKLSLGAIVEQLEKVDRRALSDQRAAALSDETQLRILALKENIAWESGKEEVRRQLIAKGYRVGSQPTVRNLPHWSEPKDSDSAEAEGQ